MRKSLQRLVALLLLLVLCVGLVPAAYAAETEPAQTEAAEETTPTEETMPTEAAAEETAEEPWPEEEGLMEEELPLSILSLDDGIATLAETEIVGQPNAFGNLFLLNGGVDIPSFDHVQHKEHIPLYSVYLQNQPGYANNYYVAYCIEPGVVLGNSGGHSGSSTTVGGMTDGSGALSHLTREQVRAIGVALLYGETQIASRKDAEAIRMEKLRRHAATQVIVWEIACGWRSATPPYARSNATLYNAISPTLELAVQVWNSKFKISGIGDAYDQIVAKMERHDLIPSFASAAQAGAKTYTLSPDGTGKYSVTLTDTNNILSEYTFQNTDTVTYTVNGNKLTITANAPVSGLLVAPTKRAPDLDSQVFYVWEYKEQQRLMSCKLEPAVAPIPAYLKISTPSNGALALTKVTEDGKNLSGWQFGIYADAACSKLLSGPHTTDNQGNISVTNLSPGTVYVKELGHTDPAIQAKYHCTSQNPQQVTIASGKTASVSFRNDLVMGVGKIIKKTNTGKDVAGWKFGVYTDAACRSPITGSPFTSDAKGEIVLSLPPGDYYVQEVDESGSNPAWTYDTTVKKLTVTPGGTASVTFQNTHYGYAKIIKQTNTGGTLSGWKFDIFTDADCTQLLSGSPFVSGADGTVIARILPGNYFVKEREESSQHPGWTFDKTIHVITVQAGQTAAVTFRNTQQGQVKIVKSMPDGGSVAGWEFEVRRVSDKSIVGTFVTPEDGSILTGYLEPGEYEILEKLPEDSLYVCESPNPQKVVVAAGQTATVTFTNRLRPGKIAIQKVDHTGAPRAGAEFLLEWSEDGTSWLPVASAGGSKIGKGTCATPGLADGRLTSGEDGMVVFQELHPGVQYRLTETKAPAGFQLLAGYAYEGSLPEQEDYVLSLTVVNVPSFTLPETGSRSILLTIISLGVCLAGLAGALIYLRKRRW